MNLTRLLLLFEPDGRSPSGQQQNRPRYDACERAVQSICVQFELQLLLLSQRERLNRAIEEHRKVLNAEAIDGPLRDLQRDPEYQQARQGYFAALKELDAQFERASNQWIANRHRISGKGGAT